jgi:hypothetical protein
MLTKRNPGELFMKEAINLQNLFSSSTIETFIMTSQFLRVGQIPAGLRGCGIRPPVGSVVLHVIESGWCHMDI